MKNKNSVAKSSHRPYDTTSVSNIDFDPRKNYVIKIAVTTAVLIV